MQIGIIDIVFSLDSVITAVGLVQHVEVMIAAIVISVLIMMMAAGSISRFVEDHPTIKMLALSFLLLIGVTLIAEGLDVHVPQRLHLLRHGVLVRRRNAEYPRAQAPHRADQAATADRRWEKRRDRPSE